MRDGQSNINQKLIHLQNRHRKLSWLVPVVKPLQTNTERSYIVLKPRACMRCIYKYRLQYRNPALIRYSI